MRSSNISDTLGPCAKGHVFAITEVSGNGSRAECQCKSFHARAADGACYRLYTRGPCAQDEMISRGGRCVKVRLVPNPKGHINNLFSYSICNFDLDYS